MKSFMKLSSIIVLMLATLAILTGCSTPGSRVIPSWDPISTAASPDILRIGISPNYPPVIFKRNNEIVGLEADLARRLCEEMGREPVFVEMPFAKLIPSLMNGKIDIIMSGMSITDQRSIRVAFTAPYLAVGQLGLIRNSDIHKYDNVTILVGKTRIGVERGTTGALFVERNCRQAKMKTYDSAERAAKALINGNVDVVIHDAPTVWWLSSEYESAGLTYQPQAFTKEYIAWGMLPERPDLYDQVEGILDRWQERGVITKYCNRWLPKF